jgi:ubiquinone/menaquinone biosynthesis C-methylase UbiE
MEGGRAVATNYDEVAPSYDQRYQRHGYAGIATALLELAGAAPKRILELGCGTGHWLELLAANGHRVTGVDPSPGMLAKARPKQTGVLVRALAEALPFPSGHFDRVVIINALHHFQDPQRAFAEARRVLSPSGALLNIALDPSSELDEWAIYDFFPSTCARDRERYPATRVLRDWLEDLGFADCHTFVAELIEQEVPAKTALTSGALARHVTSQLSELSAEAYSAGIAAIASANAQAEARGETLQLRSRLHLFATVATAR